MKGIINICEKCGLGLLKLIVLCIKGTKLERNTMLDIEKSESKTCFMSQEFSGILLMHHLWNKDTWNKFIWKRKTWYK